MPVDPTFEELLRATGRTALHLEMRDGYSTMDPAYAAWRMDRGIDPLAWYGSWPDVVGQAARRGVVVRRARIVSEPVSEYVRFEYEITAALNIAAGEEVRWLPRRQASDLALPGNDFWLFDESVVQLNHFTGDGESAGHEVSRDPALVKSCASAFAAVWQRALPHEKYQPA